LPEPPGRVRLAGWPNVCLPIPITAFRAQGRLSQLSARSGLYGEGQTLAAGGICW